MIKMNTYFYLVFIMVIPAVTPVSVMAGGQLVGRWDFENPEDPWADSSGKFHHGTYLSFEPTATWDPIERVADEVQVGTGALRSYGKPYDPAGFPIDYIEIPSSITGLFGDQEATLVMWVKLQKDPSTPANGRGGLVCFTAAYQAGGQPYEMHYPFRNSNCYINVFRQDRPSMGPLNTIVPDKTVWHQLVFVIDAAGNYKIYQNAQEAFSETGVSFGFDAGRGVCLGASTLGNRDNPCLDGWLDDVQLYNWPLELNHIETLYNNPGSVIDPNNDGTRLPVGRWNFENENDPWADSSGNGYHGTHVFAPPVMATRTTEDVGVGLGALSSSGASDDVIELPYMLDHFSEEQGSLALWVKLERDPPLTNQDGLLEFSTATEEVRYPFADPCDPDSHITTLRDSRFDVNLNTMVPDKTVWHHLVFTIDTEGNYKIYQNGQEVAGDTGAAFGLGSRAYLLGQGQAGYPRLDGYLDDVQLYNYALSAANVLYLSEHPGQTVGCLGNLRADVNGDCIVDLLDLAAFGSEWLMDGRAR